MHATLATALLVLLSQTNQTPPGDPAAPPPVTSQTPPPGAGMDNGATQQMPPADPSGMAPPSTTGQDAMTTAPAPDTWRVERVEVPGAAGQGARVETRVLRNDGTAVTVGEGLASIQQSTRLARRAQAADTSETSTQAIVGRATILGAAGVLTVVGLAVAAFGGAVWVYSRTVSSTATDQFSALAPTAPSILVTGLIAAAIGLFALVVSGALWAWVLWRGAPPADPAVVQALGAALSWDEREAQEVVDNHNASVQPTTTIIAPSNEPSPPPAIQDGPAPSGTTPAPAPSTGTPNP